MTFVYKTPSVTPSPHPGLNGSRAQVQEIQRRRLIAVAVEAVQELGYARVSVAQIVSRARVSRKTFYEIFTGREDCFLAAFELGVSQARLLMSEAYERKSGWREGVRAALASLLAFMEEEPGLTRLCVLEAPRAGEWASRRGAAVLAELAALIDRGRAFTSSGREPSALTAEIIVGGIFAVLHTRLLQEGDEPLMDLLGSLMSTIVLPYLGPRAASRELSRPAFQIARDRRTPRPPSSEDPLEGVKIRLTYRTARVLTVIAERPGASNREVAEGSGVLDQGQMSKLLRRLADLNLVENHSRGERKGGANAWRLTRRGAQLLRVIRPGKVLA